MAAKPPSLMDQLNAMALKADEAKDSAAKTSQELNTKVVKQRRKSRDLEMEALGMDLSTWSDISAKFTEFDTDGSGGISQTELKVALQSVKGVSLPEDRILRKMIKCHLNADCKNGELDLKAFTELVKDIQTDTFVKKVSDEDARLKALFKQIDADSSGSISEAELKTALADVKGGPKGVVSEETYKRMFKFADTKVGDAMEFSETAFYSLVDEIEAGKFD